MTQATGKTLAQRMEEFTKRWHPANSRRERFIALRDAELQRNEELKKELVQKFGTADLEQLRAMLKKIEENREQILFDAEMELGEVESALAEVEKRTAF